MTAFYFPDEDPAVAAPVYATSEHMLEQARRAVAVEGGDFWVHYAKQYGLGRQALRHAARVKALDKGLSVGTVMRMYP